MRRSDSAAQRGTSISRTTPPATGPSGPGGPAAPPGSASGTTGPAGLRRPAPGARAGLRRTALPGRVVVELPARRADRRLRAVDAPAATGLDGRTVGLLRAWGADPRVAAAVRVLGLAGEHGAVWLAAGAAGALADPERRDAWLRATAVVAAAHVASMGAKRLVRRPRPRVPGAAPLVATAGRHSFPSSHATSSAAAVTAFGALLPGTAAVPVLAAAICVSRLVAGVHYPSDVVCGALLGAVAARLGRTWALGAHHGCAAGGGSRG